MKLIFTVIIAVGLDLLFGDPPGLMHPVVLMGKCISRMDSSLRKHFPEDEDGEFQLHLRVAARLSSEKREQLLSVSATGKNESAKGLMGRLRDFFDWGSDEDLSAISSPLLLPDMFDHSSSPALDWEWSMTRYRSALSERMEQNDPDALEAWDELEKSVVKHVADDVKVFIRGGVVEMIILKKMA